MVLTTKDFDERLDLARWVGQRQATFIFRRVLGSTGEPLGEINPIRDTVPVLAHDTSRTIKRQLTIALGVRDTELINPVTDRISVAMLIHGVEYPLGRYTFTDHNELQFQERELGNMTLFDEMFIVDQQLETTFASQGGTVNAELLRLIKNTAPLNNVEFSPYFATGSWNAGTTRGQVINALAVQGDYFTPWLANDSRFKMIRTVDPGTAVPALNWDAGNTVFLGNVAKTNDLLTAPNRFVVISNSGDANDASIFGTYDVPSSAPHSIANRGFVIPSVQDLQAKTSDQATAMARQLGLTQTIFERREIATAPDPRHDSYDVIHWDGDNWLEIAWSMALIEGGLMSHTLRKAYV